MGGRHLCAGLSTESASEPSHFFEKQTGTQLLACGRDGGPDREFGWAFYNAATVGSWDEAPRRCWVGGGVTLVRVYGTHLTTSELVANYRAAQVAVDV